ncbi:MAG: hypothetical protein ACRENS_09310, partial [Candidatus Eiseniibacteriota bacterium]
SDPMTSRERTHAWSLTRRMRGWLATAGLLAVAGCSAHTASVAPTGHHDDGLALSPDPAHSTARITVVLSDSHVLPSMCKYEWRRNGMPISDAESDGLEPSNFTKGDEVSVVVTIADPAGGPDRVLHADVKVENSPPKVTSVSCVIAAAPSAPAVEARVQAVDPDGDTPTFTYRWFKNGNQIDGAKDATLPLKLAGRGDQVTVEVVAHDDESASTPVRSDAMVVENRPPLFTSTPGAPQQADVEFKYQASATDPDGDPLHYELVSGPFGMSMSKDGGLSWELPQGDQHQGDFNVRIRALDPNGGEATQDFAIHLDPPIIQTTRTTVQTASSGVNMNPSSPNASTAQSAPQSTWRVVRHTYFSGDTTANH